MIDSSALQLDERTQDPTPPPNPPIWANLVERIQTGDPSGMEELYSVFSTGIRFYLCRQLGPQDVDDRVHDAFVVITQSIRRGDLREPDRLMGYVRTVVRRQVAGCIGDAVAARRNRSEGDYHAILSDAHPDPERRAIERQKIEMALGLLRSLPRRDREVLTRFYLKEQSPTQICRDMGLTETQFRLIKSRAKARFTDLGRARFNRRKTTAKAEPVAP